MTSSAQRLIYSSLIFYLADSAFAVCPPRVAGLSPHRTIVENVSVYDGIEPVDAAKFANQNHETEEEIKRRYDATTIFGCETTWANGNTVRSRDTIVTSLHVLYRDGDCDKPKPLSSCGVMYQGQGRDDLYAPAKIVASGSCPKGTKIDHANDWVVIKLAKKLPSVVRPYDIPDKMGALSIGEQVIIAGKTTGFNPDGIPGGLSKLPKAFALCSTIGVSNFNYPGMMQSNCPSDKGCSGCAILSPGPSPTILSLNSGEIPTELVCLPADGPQRSGPSQLNCRASNSVPVDGAFLEALRKIPKDR